nr:hypothetical protein CFP56_63726 [Quercus suber]
MPFDSKGQTIADRRQIENQLQDRFYEPRVLRDTTTNAMIRGLMWHDRLWHGSGNAGAIEVTDRKPAAFDVKQIRPGLDSSEALRHLWIMLSRARDPRLSVFDCQMCVFTGITIHSSYRLIIHHHAKEIFVDSLEPWDHREVVGERGQIVRSDWSVQRHLIGRDPAGDVLPAAREMAWTSVERAKSNVGQGRRPNRIEQVIQMCAVCMVTTHANATQTSQQPSRSVVQAVASQSGPTACSRIDEFLHGLVNVYTSPQSSQSQWLAMSFGFCLQQRRPPAPPTAKAIEWDHRRDEYARLIFQFLSIVSSRGIIVKWWENVVKLCARIGQCNVTSSGEIRQGTCCRLRARWPGRASSAQSQMWDRAGDPIESSRSSRCALCAWLRLTPMQHKHPSNPRARSCKLWRVRVAPLPVPGIRGPRPDVQHLRSEDRKTVLL